MLRNDYVIKSFELWAKTGKSVEVWHALPYHLLDVGACARELWTRLPPTSQKFVADLLKLQPTQVGKYVAFLAASHDIGKANKFFQGKEDAHRLRLAAWNATSEKEHARHGQGTTALLRAWLSKTWNWAVPEAHAVAACIGGHHGVFDTDHKLSTLHLEDGMWKEAAFELLDTVARVLETPIHSVPKTNLNAFVGWLAGFVTVADWMGSHEEMVTYRSVPSDLEEYWQEAGERAHRLLERFYGAPISPHSRVPVKEFLPPGTTPNAMQKLAQKISDNNFRLVVLEAPTGEGKTEAALALCERGTSEGSGIFFAMPTMATANGLIERIGAYLSASSSGTTIKARLLHSGAWLSDRDEVTVPNPSERQDAVEAEDWFNGGKRGLLDRYGVGTIDQALMGALSVKHFFVRLFGLAGKTIVIDEVHAYDVYMTNLLGVLLAWLRALGCRVILLSATLPTAKRHELLDAWGAEPGEVVEYPRITIVHDCGSTSVKTFECNKKKPLEIVPIVTEPDDSLGAAVAQLITDLVSNARTGALVVNTVGRAQAAYDLATKMAYGTGIEVSLFHARMRMSDRQRVETQSLASFGKNGDRSQPRLLIATQVVEQSLDLDFDVMVSDLAPIDLLLQRAGRLHRHFRTSDGAPAPPGTPDARQNPVLRVLVAPEMDALLQEMRERVYPSAVLQATRDWLADGQRIVSPLDVETAVQTVYGCLANIDPEQELRALMQKAVEQMDAQHRQQKRLAELITIVRPNDERAISTIMNRLIEDEEDHHHGLAAKTRLETMPSISLVVWPHDEPLPDPRTSIAAKKSLALATVRLTAHYGLISELSDLKQGDGWDRVKVLQHAKLAVLRCDGTFETNSYLFRYTTTTGLSWIEK